MRLNPAFILIVLTTADALAADASPETAVNFTRDVRPILAANCFACHGLDEEAREAELRLDLRESAVAERDGTAAIVPGDAVASEAYRRISSTDPFLRMPPPDSGRGLSAAEIDVIRRWIDAGAEYARHWSFEPPRRPATPEVQASEWPRNEIDRFILARLEAAGLQPSPASGRYALIRRLSLDLTGIPPTPQEVDAFVNDRSENAYETLVDRLLTSERFGEHWARMWLDLARYADTKGYEKDQPREIWRYRDWVIDALNADMPYDQFTIQQLAGDLLPDPSNQEFLATAFHRNTMSNDEGGTDNEEFRIAAVKDRVDTTMQVWMGLTMGCAKCHSHKYDPISQREYYRFFAAFNQTEDADRPDDAPRLSTPTPTQQNKLDQLNSQIAAVRSDYERITPAFEAARDEWARQAAGKVQWSRLHPTAVQSEGEATQTVQPDKSVLASGKTPSKDVYTLLAPSPLARISAIRLEALTDKSLPRTGPGRSRRDPNFVVSEFSVFLEREKDELQRLVLDGARADFSQKGWDVGGAIDGDTATGWAIAPQTGKPHVAVFKLEEPVSASGATLRFEISQQYGNSLLLGRFRLSVSGDDPATLEPVLSSAAEIAAIPAEQRTPAQKRQLDDAFRSVYPPTKQLGERLAKLKQQRTELQKQIPETPIMRELDEKRRRTTHIHVRGNFLEKGDEVESGMPAAFGGLPEGAAANRLAVARWLVHRDNPLTARVAVNRVWARIFGRGIVETEEDFGTQGMPPSHPLLLDWLAVEYQESLGWSLKRLLKTIVLSATYRQSAAVDPRSEKLDPENRLLGRTPRYRLPAETVRDQALAAAGLLSSKIGGPSVMPPQPPGIWRTTYSKLKWETSDDEDRYRRALYTFWRRTSPYPSLITFDAGSREVCLLRRVRTNTPLQALVVLNDPAYFEAAGALAQRMLREADDPRARVTRGFRLVLIRPPSPAESDRLVALYESALRSYRDDAAAAEKLLAAARRETPEGASPAELAAWTVVANVLLNLDETLMRN